MKSENDQNHAIILRTAVILTMIALSAVLRIAPHPWNFTPVGATALFSGAVVRDRRLAFLFPLVALFFGDLFVGLHKLIPVVYTSFLINVALGLFLRDRSSPRRIAAFTFLGALQFFLITNFGVWAFLGNFPHTAAGLLTCYLTGLPLFWNTLAGDALYATLLFGGFALAERSFPALREPQLAHAPKT